MADKMKKSNLKKDEMYQMISLELQKFKGELVSEIKVSAMQIASMYEGVKASNASSASAIAQEIRYGYKQNQNIYEGIAKLVKTEVSDKLGSMDNKVESLEKIEAVLNEISEKLAADAGLTEGEVKALVEDVVSVHSREILDALASNPTTDIVDYERITDSVAEKVLAIVEANKTEPTVIDYEKVAGDTAAKVVESLPPVAEAIDYNRINDMILAAVASAVNVDTIADAVAAKIAIPEPETVDVDAIADAVAEKVVIPAPETLDIDALADAVAEKIVLPAVEVKTEEVVIDYDKLADVVIEKLAAKGISADVILDDEGINKIADTVAEKVGTVDNIDYDKVCLAAQAAQIVPDSVDYDRVAEIVEDKLNKSCEAIERVVTLNEEGIQQIVDGVANELRNMTLVCECEEIVEETTEEVAEEPVEEPVVEEVVEEPAEEPVVEEVVEEPAEEPVVEEVVEEPAEEPVVEEVVEEPATEPADEIAVASAEPVYEEGLDGELIDAETGLVIRLKRSFVAKMKQSDEKVKAYYSDLKNELTSYKRINSNVSWHGDRFNFGRDTVAKVGINGKTLCFYLALDPNDPELKQTVYHQKDVGAQKAYESTPFMVKVKSDAALKKALRLVAILAEKLGTEKDEKFEAVDYTAEFAYESTKSLFEAGYIKATKEKKVDFNF